MPRSDLVKSVAPATQDFVAREPRIQRALELIRQNRAVHVTDIARALNLSDSRFRHLFKQELGLPPLTFVKLGRLERARKLFRTSFFLRVKEVTALVGANDMSHFVRDYKLLYRQTPSQTRAQSSRVPLRTSKGSHSGQ